MATLVLTVVGGAVGGPVGAAIGSLLGQTLDRNLIFTPGRREGPRLSDLAVQTSSYGTPIPRIYGQLRVAGTVIWSTDLIESRGSSGGGKGQPKTTTYSYSVSFAVLLSARPIRQIRRIWADGKLLRGAAGDFKSEVAGFRVYMGDEEQAVDPLIASIEGAGQSPAYRGAAYVVFERLQLADFGNHIPSLTFEVEADEGAITPEQVIGDVGQGLITTEAGGDTGSPILTGYSLQSRTLSDAIRTLSDFSGWWIGACGGTLTLMHGPGEGVTLTDRDVRVAGERESPGSRSIAPDIKAPSAIDLIYFDPARDYQAGLQRAWRRDGGQASEQIGAAAAMSDDQAAALAETILYKRSLELQTRRVAAGWDALSICTGARVSLADDSRLWRVSGWAFEKMRVMLELKPVAGAVPLVSGATASGRAVTAPDEVIGETVLQAFELPSLDNVLRDAPLLLACTGSAEAGWRSAVVSYALGDEGRSEAIGVSRISSVMGQVTQLPLAAPATIEDRRSEIRVQLLNDSMALSDADAIAMDGGANLALVGNELLQFSHAQPLGAGLWQLTGLWRGRRGTEGAIATHDMGERFVLIDAAALLSHDLPISAVGVTARLEALGVGDRNGPVGASTAISGISVTPPSPVNLNVDWSSEADMRITWNRRSRTGWLWRDGGDIPLGEQSERYSLRLSDASGWAIDLESSAPELSVPVTSLNQWPIDIQLHQIGTHGVSPVVHGQIQQLGASLI